LRPGTATLLKGIVRGVDQAAMALLGPLRRRLLLLARSEHGMALPTALFAMIASFALASVAVLSSVNAQQGTKRDHESKEAIAAADAGASVALLRLNRFQRSLTEATPCVGPGGELLSEAPVGSGWCPATTAESVGSATFSYMVSAFKKGSELSVVAVGSSGGVSRRVEVGLTSHNGTTVFAHERLIGKDDITIKGANGLTIHTDIGTNGSIEGDGSAKICGNIRRGPGKSSPTPAAPPACLVQGTITEGEQDLPPVTPPVDIATNNSNCRLVPSCTKGTEVDIYATKSPKEHRTSTVPWDPIHRTINIQQNTASLTMGGRNYFICGLFLKGGQLIMAAGPEVRIFVDTPEHCGLSPGATQVEITGNANIVSTGFNPAEVTYALPGIYLLGSGSVSLTGSSGTNELLLYAPESSVDLGGSATWFGMIAGKSLRLHGSPTMESDPNLAPPEETIQSLWERTRYVECTGAGASPPNASC
jgi:hypothetical protein